MAKYKVELDKAICIGAAECETVSPKFWKVLNDGKAHIIGGAEVQGTGKEELIVEENDLQANVNAAKVCPVKAIRVNNMETGQVLL